MVHFKSKKLRSGREEWKEMKLKRLLGSYLFYILNSKYYKILNIEIKAKKPNNGS